MLGFFDKIEAALMWGTVVFAAGLVIYLAYLQYRTVKRRRARRRHRARRERKQGQLETASPQPDTYFSGERKLEWRGRRRAPE